MINSHKGAEGGSMGDLPTEAMELTHLLVVSDIERSRTFYRDVLGAEVYRVFRRR
jgi:hypothetical protein